MAWLKHYKLQLKHAEVFITMASVSAHAYEPPPDYPNVPSRRRLRRVCYGVIILIILVLGSSTGYLVYDKFFSGTSSGSYLTSRNGGPLEITLCPDQIRANAPAQSNYTDVFWREPMALNPAKISSIVSSHDRGERFFIGSTKVTYTFTDKVGNTAVCSFDVLVVDVTPPEIINCPLDQKYSNTSNNEEILWTEPTSTDNSGGTVTVTQSHQRDFMFPVGDTKISYQFSDESGNQALCVFIITVVDVTAPSVQQCPGDITSEDGVSVTWLEPTATDNSGEPVTIEQTHYPGLDFTYGITEVTYIFRDQSGVEAFCIFHVKVLDTIPPTIHQCPNDTIVQGANSTEPISWSIPYATDNSGNVTLLSESHHPGSHFSLGTTVVEYVFGDADGNTVTCSFSVTLVEGETNEPGETSLTTVLIIGASILGGIVFLIIFCACLCYKNSSPHCVIM